MQYHVSNYGVFSPLCTQVYAFDENTSLASESAISAVNKSIFTLGIGGQANTVAGIASGIRYASNLKWSYSTLPATDSDFHQGIELADGCSRGDSDTNMDWTHMNTVFITDSEDSATWSYGKVYCSTGAQSPTLVATLFFHNGSQSVIASYTGRVSFNAYVVMNNPMQFKYARHQLTSIYAGSYSYRTGDGISDMRMFYSVDAPDEVKTVAKFESIRAGKLFRFTPEELNFGQLMAGTRPKVQSYLKATYYL